MPNSIFDEQFLAGKRVLVVDEKLYVAELTKDVLQMWGAEVYMAHDAQTTFDLVTKTQPPLI